MADPNRSRRRPGAPQGRLLLMALAAVWSLQARGDDLGVAWSQRYGEDGRTYLLGPAAAGKDAVYLPVTIVRTDGTAAEDGSGRAAAGKAEEAVAQDEVWQVDPNTGRLGARIDLGPSAGAGTRGGTVSAVRGIVPLDDGRLLVVATGREGGWDVLRLTADGAVEFRKRLDGWLGPVPAPVGRRSGTLAGMVALPDERAVVFGTSARDDMGGGKAVGIDRDGTALWTRDYAPEAPRPADLTTGCAVPGGALLAGQAYPTAKPDEPVPSGVWLIEIDAEGRPRRQSVVAGAYPAVGTTGGGLPAVAHLTGPPAGERGERIALRGFAPDLEQERWLAVAFRTERMVGRPAVTGIPGGLAAATTVTAVPAGLEAAAFGEDGRLLRRGRVALAPAGFFGTTIARRGDRLIAFTVVEGADGPASRRVFGVGFRLDAKTAK